MRVSSEYPYNFLRRSNESVVVVVAVTRRVELPCKVQIEQKYWNHLINQ